MEDRLEELTKQLSKNHSDHLARIINLEAFKHTCKLDVELLIQQRREIKRQVDSELHALVDTRKKIELTIEDFIKVTRELRINQNREIS